MKSALIKAAAGRKTERCVAFSHRAALLFPCVGDHYEPLTELVLWGNYLDLHQVALTVLLLLTVS